MDFKKSIIILGILLFFGSCGKNYLIENQPQKKSNIKITNTTIDNTIVTKDFSIKKGYTEIGTASWYGPNFHGKWTASGKRYDMNKMSCAHKYLPLGTLVEIKNLKTGDKIKVTVEDRGPYVYGRIVDLSKKAALKLGIIKTGLAKVQLKVLKLPKHISDYYVIQVGAFQDLEKAIKLQKKLVKEHFPAFIRNIDNLYKLYIGPYPSRNRCEIFQQKLLDHGFEKGFIRKFKL